VKGGAGLKVAIIGAGVLGTALGVLLRRAGYEIAALCSRNRRTAQVAAAHIGGAEVVGDPGLAAMGADLVVLAVPDRAIPSVAIEVAAGGALRRGAVVAHLAGGLPAGILAGVTAAGGHRGAMHPLQSVADVETAVQSLPRSFFFLEGDREAVDLLRSVVLALDGRPVEIEARAKALYHAGAAAASNFLVTLLDYAASLLQGAGVPGRTALEALLPLVKGTIANVEAVGLPDALTGPVARGDVGTVRRHLRALAAMPGDVAHLYRLLARRTVDVGLRKGSLSREDADALLDLLAPPDRPDASAPPPAAPGGIEE
jgi:predicted short-subunit dehydrogenase-like oxidoreductase (DUF2520 family)